MKIIKSAVLEMLLIKKPLCTDLRGSRCVCVCERQRDWLETEWHFKPAADASLVF